MQELSLQECATTNAFPLLWMQWLRLLVTPETLLVEMFRLSGPPVRKVPTLVIFPVRRLLVSTPSVAAVLMVPFAERLQNALKSLLALRVLLFALLSVSKIEVTELPTSV